jgi:NADPH:quinone reductase-like Zn-dependent oxidoreductase
MSLTRKILSGIAILITLAFAALAFAISYNAPCPTVALLPDGAARMKAVTARCYGSPDIIRVEDVAKPVPQADQILIRVHAASVNPLDWRTLRGSPYMLRLDRGIGAPTPEEARLGADFSGTVEAVGTNVTKFKPGDAVFGGGGGTLAQYIVKRETGAVVLKPQNVTFEQAASVNVGAITALQALRDHGAVQPGQKVLINGASGGVGTFSVQIAKLLGAEVTAVCSTRNAELVRSLGADHIVDYTQADFAAGDARYDVIVDNVANRSLSDLRRVLQPNGRLVIVGGAHGNWIGPFALPLKALILSPFVDQKMGMMIAQSTQADMQYLADLMAAGKLTPVIDRTYPLSEAAESLRYLETGRARGKVVVTID